MRNVTAMSDVRAPEAGEQEWPENCPLCDTPMQTREVGFAQDPEESWAETHSPGTVMFEDYCPNPDCPGKESDLAKAAPGQ